ncbi:MULTISPECIES: hypothetical protein [unclassified Sporolactobacillus]|uniref:hypothetical protein n=1 Tax=unclassified Sporolactobacillus TaxID=2628533 RepID=UPI0023687C56|nr:hypothetical protein [Sporolactobacillus sp. CQH2019]MDD9148323.1 hypothetical protein [Sporolactobacillus sp. CQH2019]
MKNIFSFKVCAAAFRVKPMIRFYRYCEKMGQTVYVYGKNKVEKVHQLPELLSFLFANLSRENDCLVVVEGDHVKQLKRTLLKVGGAGMLAEGYA